MFDLPNSLKKHGKMSKMTKRSKMASTAGHCTFQIVNRIIASQDHSPWRDQLHKLCGWALDRERRWAGSALFRRRATMVTTMSMAMATTMAATIVMTMAMDISTAIYGPGRKSHDVEAKWEHPWSIGASMVHDPWPICVYNWWILIDMCFVHAN